MKRKVWMCNTKDEDKFYWWQDKADNKKLAEDHIEQVARDWGVENTRPLPKTIRFFGWREAEERLPEEWIHGRKVIRAKDDTWQELVTYTLSIRDKQDREVSSCAISVRIWRDKDYAQPHHASKHPYHAAVHQRIGGTPDWDEGEELEEFTESMLHVIEAHAIDQRLNPTKTCSKCCHERTM